MVVDTDNLDNLYPIQNFPLERNQNLKHSLQNKHQKK